MDEKWYPIQTVPMDGSPVVLAGADGSDSWTDGVPDEFRIAETRWIVTPGYDQFVDVGDGYYRKEYRPGHGKWINLPGQMEYIFAWRRPYRQPVASEIGEPIDDRGDGFETLALSQIDSK